MYSGHENRIPHFAFSFILLLSIQCASHKTEATYIFLNILFLIQFLGTAIGGHSTLLRRVWNRYKSQNLIFISFHWFFVVSNRIRTIFWISFFVCEYWCWLRVWCLCVWMKCSATLGLLTADAIKWMQFEREEMEKKLETLKFLATNGRAGQIRSMANLMHFKMVPSLIFLGFHSKNK